MPDLFALRGRDDASSPLYPVPGQVRNSILLAHADGVPTLFSVRRASVSGLGGRIRSRHRRMVPVESTLIVTDCRTAVACSAYSPAQGMLVGHVRHGWLDGVAVGAEAVRLTINHPDDARLALVMWFGTHTLADAAAREIARRACQHDSARFVFGSVRGRWSTLVTTAGAR